MKLPQRKDKWMFWPKRLLMAIALIACLTLLMTSCKIGSTSAVELDFCRVYQRQVCARGDRVCTKNELAHYCHCETEAPELPKVEVCTE